MNVYYNENDPQMAAWLRALINAGELPAGDVDERSIEDVIPTELAGYRQCHFFAGIGGWPLALQWAGWGDAPVWTGSCPCQPFSAAGKRGGADDPRSLWWAFRWLIDKCRPPAVFGEQVASKSGREWLAGVRADLETLGYAVGAADLCAAGVGAPHIRQRLWWVGHTRRPGTRRDTGAVLEAKGETPLRSVGHRPVDAGADGWMGDPIQPRLEGHSGHGGHGREPGWHDAAAHGSVAETGGWSDFVWVPCADGKARRIEPGIEPLVDGLPGRVGLLRGYGNAIVPQEAAEFIQAFGETQHDP